jgi:hypothetical protein
LPQSVLILLRPVLTAFSKAGQSIKAHSLLLLRSIQNVEGVAFLVLCDKSYPKRLAFSFLDEVQQAFFAEYPLPQIEVIHRPYSFMKFGNIEKERKIMLQFLQ